MRLVLLWQLLTASVDCSVYSQSVVRPFYYCYTERFLVFSYTLLTRCYHDVISLNNLNIPIRTSDECPSIVFVVINELTST